MPAPTLSLVTLPGWMHPPEGLDALRGAVGQAFPDRRLRWIPLPWQTVLREGELTAKIAACAGPCLLLGWSLGALAALELAAKAPPGLEGLVLLGATARLPEDAARAYPGVAPALLTAMRRRLRTDPTGLFRDFHGLCLHPDAATVPEGEAFLRRALAQDPRDAAAGLDLLDRKDLRAVLPEIPVPVVLLHGAQDAVVPVAQARFLAERLPRARLRILPGQGHLLRRGHEGGALTALLRDFSPRGGGDS